MKPCLCHKCNMRWALQESGIYPLCYICFLKVKRLYRHAIKTIKSTDWWNYKTKISERKVGWSFSENLLWCLVLAHVMNCGSLNKTPKCPEILNKSKLKRLLALGVSHWRTYTALNYYELEN